MPGELIREGLVSPPHGEHTQIEVGTIGWEDEDVWYELGKDGTDEEGYTLVRVQLFRGRDFTKPLKPGVGQGTKLLCHVSSNLFRVPKKDVKCYVAIPAGMGTSPTSGVIFATVEKSPIDQFSQNRVAMAFPDHDLIIKAKSITISDYEDNYLGISPELGVQMADKDGDALNVSDGQITGVATGGVIMVVGGDGQPAKSGLYLVDRSAAVTAGVSMIKLNGITQMGTWIGASVTLYAGNVNLGTGATPATPVTVFPGIPSSTVFVQP